MADFFELPIHEMVKGIAPEQLLLPKARDFAMAVLDSTSAVLVDGQRISGKGDSFFKPGDEVVIFDLSLQVGQRPVNDIGYVERIAVQFDSADRLTPWVYALRGDFPKVLHLNALHFEHPSCLCVYENSYEELKLEWRAAKFLADIRSWLELTAKDQLHQDDQPLEPFLISNMGTVIIPPDVEAGETLFVYPVAQSPGRLSLVASRLLVEGRERYPAHVVLLKGIPQPHGIAGLTPNNLTDLHEMIIPAGIDVLKTVQGRLHAMDKVADELEKRLMLFFELPKTTARNGVNENDFYVFLTAENAGEIGLHLGLLQKNPDNGQMGNVLFEEINSAPGRDLGIGTLLPQVQLTADWALLLSGNFKEYDRRETKIFQIGTGALGSQFFMNQARSGFGRWVLTDHDFLMPHNLVRHASDMHYLGNFKSIGLAVTANQLFGGADFALALKDNYLYPGDPEQFEQYMMEAAVILDVSTSVAVARDLAARSTIAARRISMFLSPNGYDLVILAEDEARAFPLDLLEFQYYRYLHTEPGLAGHLESETGIRLSNSCRDITARIPQEAVAILAGVAANQFRKIIKSPEAAMGIWRMGESQMSVTPHNLAVPTVDTWEIEDWTIYVGRPLIDEITAARLLKLPNETGGILIGGYDLERKKIYLTSTILSPSDSEEYPNAYIRGTAGVEVELLAYRDQTADHLKYAGEWHSHPEGYALNASNDDRILFQHIHQEMQHLGFPTLMIIAGDHKTYEVYFQP